MPDIDQGNYFYISSEFKNKLGLDEVTLYLVP